MNEIRTEGFINKAVNFKESWFWEEQRKTILKDEKANNLMVLSAINEATVDKKLINTRVLVKQLPISYFELSMSIDELDDEGYIHIFTTPTNKELLGITENGKALLMHAL